MATTRLMTTVLPHSVAPDADFHVSLFFTHRLIPDGAAGTLTDFPVLIDWPGALSGAQITLRVNGSPDPIACRPLTAVLNPAGWAAAFPASTTVTPFPAPKITQGAPWQSFPASAMGDHGLDAHYASVFSSPVTPPSVSSSRLATAVLAYCRRIDGIGPLLGEFTAHRRRRGAYEAAIDKARRDRAQSVRDGCDCTDGGDRGLQQPESLLSTLFDRRPGEPSAFETFDRAVSDHLSGLLRGSPRPQPEGPVVAFAPAAGQAAPVERMLVDSHASAEYYRRPEESEPPPLAEGESRPRPDAPEVEFHSLAAAAGNTPALARRLGFVLDLKVDDPATLVGATEVTCEVTIPGVEKLLSPVTRCAVDGDRFMATNGADGRWESGLLTVGRPEYRVLDLDPDAAGLKLEQHLRSAARAQAAEFNGDEVNFAPATLRSNGFAIANTNRVTAVRGTVGAAENRSTDILASTPGVAAPRFTFGELVRGLQVQVWDDHTRVWHSLHDRTVTVEVNGTVVLTDVPDSGLLQGASPSRVPGDPANPYYLHEVVAGWDGWSLSAPRPGRNIVHDSGQGVDPGSEILTDNGREATPGAFVVRSSARAGSLPALRYGRRYAFRVLGVDLAGNVVSHPTDTVAADALDPVAVVTAETHVQTLRQEFAARDAAGFLASQRSATGPANAGGLVGRVHDAMARIEQVATSLKIRPQLDTPATDFAVLFAQSGGPETVTTPRLFLRWDPVTEPTIVPRHRLTFAESLNRMVIRTTDAGSTTTERHVIPPKVSQTEAELGGRFDALMTSPDPAARRRAYATALRERGNLFHTSVQDLDDPLRTNPVPWPVRLESAPTVDPAAAVTLEQLQHRSVRTDPAMPHPNDEAQPAAGQYVVHDTDALVVPYLPDPMARGVALIFYEAGADHHLADRRILQSVTIPYSGGWPAVAGLRLVLHSADTLGAEQHGNEVRIGLPPGEQVGVAVSSIIDRGALETLGLWRFHAVHDPAVSATDRAILEEAATDGWLWWLTPSTDLRLVNATTRPATPPMITALRTKPRVQGVLGAEILGTLDIHGSSTDSVELRATWSGIVDDPALPEAGDVSGAEVVSTFPVGAQESSSILSIAQADGPRPVGVPERPVTHTLPDTRTRVVTYRLHGSSRYREFFEPAELPAADDPASAGNGVEVRHLSSQRPPAPVVHEVLPMFFWEELSEPQHPFAVRRIRHSALRIWLDRPWFASGDGEQLAVMIGAPDAPAGQRDVVSLWGRDPAVLGPGLGTATELPLQSAWEERALALEVDVERRPGRPHGRVADRDNVIGYLFTPEYDVSRRRWFVDVRFDAADKAWPFVRLNVARYQPNAIDDCHFSSDTNTDFVQLLPQRICTLSRPREGSVRVTVSGTFAVTDHPGTDAAAAGLQGGSATVARMRNSRQMRASLQTRAGDATSDLDWSTVTSVDCDLEGADPQSFAASWSGELPLEPAHRLATPGADTTVRVLLEEHELLPTDAEPGQTAPQSISRLVYADHLYL